MFTITSTTTSNASGATVIIAKGAGRQRTVKSDPSHGVYWNHGAAVGTLLHALLSPEQRAKMLHPTGRQRVKMTSVSDGGGKYRWTFDV